MTITTDTIVELTTTEQWLESLPVLKELRTDLTEELFLSLMKDMIQEGYRLFALKTDNQIKALAGVAFKTNFYYKKHLFVYDLVTSSDSRSNGYGKKLLDYIHLFAQDNGCGIVALESGLQRKDAHRFYEGKMGYEKFCYSFKKLL